MRVFESGEQRSIKGIVLSNICDIDPENSRTASPRVIFAPLTELPSFENMLRKAGLSDKQINSKISAIREQRTTNVFFLPAKNRLGEDVIVRLDDLHSMPVDVLIRAGNGKKKLTLRDTGYYMLLFKLSVHFCRIQEAIHRGGSV